MCIAFTGEPQTTHKVDHTTLAGRSVALICKAIKAYSAFFAIKYTFVINLIKILLHYF